MPGSDGPHARRGRAGATTDVDGATPAPGIPRRPFGGVFRCLAARLDTGLMLAATALSTLPSPARADPTAAGAVVGGRRRLRPGDRSHLGRHAVRHLAHPGTAKSKRRTGKSGSRSACQRTHLALPVPDRRQGSPHRRVGRPGHAGRSRRRASGRDRRPPEQFGIPCLRPVAGAALGSTSRTGGRAPSRRRRTIRPRP